MDLTLVTITHNPVQNYISQLPWQCESKKFSRKIFEIFLQVPKKKKLQTRGFAEKLAQLCNKYSFSQESSDWRDTRKPAQRKFSENRSTMIKVWKENCYRQFLSMRTRTFGLTPPMPEPPLISVSLLKSIPPSLNFSKKMTSC